MSTCGWAPSSHTVVSASHSSSNTPIDSRRNTRVTGTHAAPIANTTPAPTTPNCTISQMVVER